MIFFLKAHSIRIQFLKFHFNVSFSSVKNCIIVNQCEYHTIIRWIHLLLKRIGKSNVSMMKIQYKRACLRATWIKLTAFSSLHQISNLQLMFGLFFRYIFIKDWWFWIPSTTDAPLIPNMFHVAGKQRWMKLLVRSFRCSFADALFLRLALSRFVLAKCIG